jgi:dTMP kinase
VDIETLIPRVIEADGLNYWESGMDMHLDRDYFESFRKYQMLLIHEFDVMAKEYGFDGVDASASVDAIQEKLREKVAGILKS